MFKRVLIIGCSGSGKSTLSRKLHRLSKLPIVHLDALFWLPNWVKKPRELFKSQVVEALQQPEWIIDGNFDSTLDLRIKYADLVIFLDFSRKQCLAGVLGRYMKNRGKTRIDMGAGCVEKIDWAFLTYIWSFNDASRPDILEQVRRARINSIVFTNRKQVEKWLIQLEAKMDGKVVHGN